MILCVKIWVFFVFVYYVMNKCLSNSILNYKLFVCEVNEVEDI